MTFKSAQPCLILLFLILANVSAAPSPSLLIKLADRPGLSKQNAAAGVAIVDEILAEAPISQIEPVFSERPHNSVTPDLRRWISVEFSKMVDLEYYSRQLSQSRNVAHVQPNRRYPLHYIPNDSLYNEQYALRKIYAAEAWDVTQGSKDVLVAIIDTGIDYTHPDLRDNIWLNTGEDINNNNRVDDSDFNGIDDDENGFIDDIRGWDFTDAPNYPAAGDYLDRDNDPMDEHGHGTGIAGIIAAVTDNEIGIAGVAPHSRIMSLRSFNAAGYGEEDDLASALLYAIEQGASVVNMSFGDVFVSRIIDDIVQYAYQQGIVLVASAGNSATDEIHYPSGFAETISVGATDEEDYLAGFSNWGQSIDLVAPGSLVLSTTLKGAYQRWSGTSFSAPYVTGAVALLLSQQNVSVDAVRSILVNSCDDLGDPGWDSRFGAGRLDLIRMLGQDQHAIAQISQPHLDDGYSAGPIQIIGSAWCPSLAYYELHYGEGVNPSEWHPVSGKQMRRVIDDVLYVWDSLPEEQGEYTLKLTVVGADQLETHHSTRIFIDKTPPIITDVDILPMLDDDRHSVLVQFQTDDLCEGSIYLQSLGEPEIQQVPLTYRTRTLRYNLSQQQFDGPFKIWLEALNGAGLRSLDNNQGQRYDIDLSTPSIDVSRFSPSLLSLPFGRTLAKTGDFNRNSTPELIMSEGENGALGQIVFYEYRDGSMNNVFSLPRVLIPRDIGDSDSDGNMELLCGFGFSSFLYEAQTSEFPESILQEWTGDGGKQYWASRIADLDQDARGEIIMRIIRPTSEGSIDQFEVLEKNDDGYYPSVAEFANPTPGDNFNGVPHCIYADFDGDSRLEILLGDSDGDLFIYECTGDNLYTNTWQDSLPLLDSIAFTTAGDFDGDGRREFIAGCHSDANLNTEHDYDARHWCYRLFDQFGDNDYRSIKEWRIFGFESPRDFLSSVSSGDLDDDGRDEICIAAYPDVYLIDYRNGQYEVVYHKSDIQTSACTIDDFDRDGFAEFWLGDGITLFAYEQLGDDSGPATPVDVKAQPLDEQTVSVTWREIKNVDQYQVYRGFDVTTLRLHATVKLPGFLDESVKSGGAVYYAVKAVDFDKEPVASRMSRVVSARPGKRPALISAEQETQKSIRLRFSESLNSTCKMVTNYNLADTLLPTSVAHDKSGREVVLSFRHVLEPKEYTIHCRNLFDSDNTPLDTLQNRAVVTIRMVQRSPYIVDAHFLENFTIELNFDQPMQKKSVESVENYLINEDSIVENANRGVDGLSVALEVPRLSTSARTGDTVRVKVNNLMSESGKAIRAGRGDAVHLVFGEQDSTISQMLRVYPNPYTVHSGVEHIVFDNVKDNDTVYILSSTGRLVKKMSQAVEGRLYWDLKNEQGNAVASGIYIYRITGEAGERTGKLAVVR